MGARHHRTRRFMRKFNGIVVVAVLASSLWSIEARADQQVYTYRIIHSKYGEIGTYTNIIKHFGNDTEVDSEMHVAVRMFGITVYREDAERTENWHNDRFVAFHGTTHANGDTIEVRGEARDNSFVVESPQGTVVAPGSLHPSNPWSPMVLETDEMMSTKTGRIEKVQVTGEAFQPASFDTASTKLREFEIISDKRQFVWFDDQGIPVAFRAEVKGAPVDFILVR